MKNKSLYHIPIKGYQYISKMFPASCRYYPSCSEYASWHFQFNAPHKALLASSLRILRCNQFFAGGIDYPRVTYTPPKLVNIKIYTNISIEYWIVPEKSHFVIIKQFKKTL